MFFVVDRKYTKTTRISVSWPTGDEWSVLMWLAMGPMKKMSNFIDKYCSIMFNNKLIWTKNIVFSFFIQLDWVNKLDIFSQCYKNLYKYIERSQTTKIYKWITMMATIVIILLINHVNININMNTMWLSLLSCRQPVIITSDNILWNYHDLWARSYLWMDVNDDW